MNYDGWSEKEMLEQQIAECQARLDELNGNNHFEPNEPEMFELSEEEEEKSQGGRLTRRNTKYYGPTNIKRYTVYASSFGCTRISSIYCRNGNLSIARRTTISATIQQRGRGATCMDFVVYGKDRYGNTVVQPYYIFGRIPG